MEHGSDAGWGACYSGTSLKPAGARDAGRDQSLGRKAEGWPCSSTRLSGDDVAVNNGMSTRAGDASSTHTVSCHHISLQNQVSLGTFFPGFFYRVIITFSGLAAIAGIGDTCTHRRSPSGVVVHRGRTDARRATGGNWMSVAEEAGTRRSM
jgi:hypothetical protein